MREGNYLSTGVLASTAAHVGLIAYAALWSVEAPTLVSFRGASHSQPISLTAKWLKPAETKPQSEPTKAVSIAAPSVPETMRAMQTTVQRRLSTQPSELPATALDSKSPNLEPAASYSPAKRTEPVAQATVDPTETKPLERAPLREMKPALAAVAAPQPIGVDDETPPNFSVTRQPQYPPASRQLGHEGDVVVRLHVSAKGVVERVEVVESSGHAALDDAARRAVSVWRGRPAMRGGRAVSTTVRLRFQFRIPQ